MAETTLTIIVEKGPKKGESIDCSPGRRVRIGRIMRGNTFAIKDSGISEKHVLFESHGDRWAVTDLDTSNGTFLNGHQIKPLVPSCLSDGDLIKLGVQTSIVVRISRISAPEETAKEPKEAAEGPRRRGRPKKGGEAVEQEVKKEDLPVRRTRGAARRAEVETAKEEGDGGTVSYQLDAGEPKAGAKKRLGAARKISSNSIPKEGEEAPTGGSSKAGNLGEEKIDMENMTLGQWFDRLEKCLPMMVNDAAEEIIAEIREKADRYNQYVSDGGISSKLSGINLDK